LRVVRLEGLSGFFAKKGGEAKKGTVSLTVAKNCEHRWGGGSGRRGGGGSIREGRKAEKRKGEKQSQSSLSLKTTNKKDNKIERKNRSSWGTRGGGEGIVRKIKWKRINRERMPQTFPFRGTFLSTITWVIFLLKGPSERTRGTSQKKPQEGSNNDPVRLSRTRGKKSRGGKRYRQKAQGTSNNSGEEKKLARLHISEYTVQKGREEKKHYS